MPGVILPFVFLLALALFTFSPLIADPDLWGHVRFGQDTLLTRDIIRTDTYSYLTSGQLWINHEWLTEVLYALAYNAAGPRGLIVLNSLLSLLIAGLIYARLRRFQMDATRRDSGDLGRRPGVATCGAQYPAPGVHLPAVSASPAPHRRITRKMPSGRGGKPVSSS